MPGGLFKRAKRPKTGPEELIDSINVLSPSAFYDRFFASHPGVLQHPDYDITLKPVTALDDDEFTACFDLIELTSADDYKNAERGWRPKEKKREMREDHMQYLLVRRQPVRPANSENEKDKDTRAATSEPHDAGEGVVAFLSFMFTIEDDYPVVYVYEIHLGEAQRGSGLGKQLMYAVDHCAREGAVDKVMLTCFRRNTVAMNFYNKLGFTEDEFSPSAKRLRGGKIKVPPYMILSKSPG